MPFHSAAATDRAWLLGGLVAVFLVSALHDVRLLALAFVLALGVFARNAGPRLLRLARTALPLSAALALTSCAWLRLTTGAWPEPMPFVALLARVLTLGFITFAILERVNLLGALEPYPTLSRLLVVTLAQIHALRLLVVESREALRSRSPRRPGALELVRNAGGLTVTLLSLSLRNAREVADAMRSRGF